jgi:hypothetical protein
MGDEPQGVMQTKQKIVEVKRQPWYIELHLSSHMATLATGVLAFFSNGGHLPEDVEGWITFIAAATLWFVGVGVSINGAKKIS